MLFSLEWLLQLCPAEREIGRIVPALTARGLTVDSDEPCGADHVLDIDVPANRPDCLGHLGVARELAAALGRSLVPHAERPETASAAPPETVAVEILAPDLCPRYTAGVVRDVRVGPSPAWVVRRLETCGLRSVSNVVDASNLVMLELGQPVHFFDLDRLATTGGGTRVIRIRTAEPGESLRTLDGIERRLETDMLLIADAERATAVAGVIGGADSEIDATTRHVMIEAAHFDPRSVRATARRLGVQTDASYRFERGVDPAAPVLAQALAARLLHDLADGTIAPGVVDVVPRPAGSVRLRLHVSELRRLLGFEPDPQEIHEALQALDLSPQAAGEGVVEVTVPSWRVDLEREADLVEEVARHLGYDRVPTAVDLTAATLDPDAEPAGMEDRSRDLLAHLGFHEAVGYAMIGAGEDDRFVPAGTAPPLALDNPIAEPLAWLRRSILPGLVRAADLNLRRGNRSVRLFEVGRVFHTAPGRAVPAEPLRVGVAWTGGGEPPHWSRPGRRVDLYDVIGLAEHLLHGIRPGQTWTRSPETLPAFHPARSIRWRSPDGATVAWGGALHPEVQRELEHELYLLEFALDRLAAVPFHAPRQQAVPRVPAVARDLSLVLTADLPYGEVVGTLAAVDPPAPARFEALDRYEGPPLAEGETALTVRVKLEPVERTLTDEEIEGYRRALVAQLEQALGVRIRS